MSDLRRPSVALILCGAVMLATASPGPCAEVRHSRVGYLEPDHRALAVKALAAARARGGRVIEVGAEGGGRFRTIQQAVDAARAGDLVLVRPGVYRERVEFRRGRDGTKARPVVLKSADRGVIVDGEKRRNCIVVRGDFVVVDGIECRNARLGPKSPEDATIVSWGARGTVVRNCHCHGATDEYKVADIAATASEDFLFRNNLCASRIVHGIDAAWNAAGVIEYNEVSGCYSAFYISSGAKVELRHNYAHDFRRGGDGWHGSGVVCRDTQGAQIHHNLFVGAQASGILLYDFLYASHNRPGMPGYNQPNERHRACSNTLVGGLFGIELSGDVEDCLVRENVLVEASHAAVRFYGVPAGNGTNRFERNVHWQCGRAVESEPRRELSRGELLRADPAFVDAGKGDYRLRRNSPLVDAGDPEAEVPAGGGRRADIGAYELLYEEARPASPPLRGGGRRRQARGAESDPLAGLEDILQEARALSKGRGYAEAAAAFDAAAAKLTSAEAKEACGALAASMRRNRQLLEAVIRSPKEAEGLSVYIDVAGIRVRGKVVSVAEEAVRVKGRGVEARLSWEDVSDEAFCKLAARCCPKTPEWHLRLALFCAEAGLAKRAEEALSLAVEADPGYAKYASLIRSRGNARDAPTLGTPASGSRAGSR